MWRVVAQSRDPLSHEGNFTDSQQLHNPTRCKTYEELPGQLAQWRKSLERWTARTSETLADSTQKEAILRMCPAELELDMRKHYENFDSIPKMERYIQNMVNHELEVQRKRPTGYECGRCPRGTLGTIRYRGSVRHIYEGR